MNVTIKEEVSAITKVGVAFCNHLNAPFGFKRIIFTDSGAARYAAVIGYIMGMKLAGKVDESEELANHFITTMENIDSYGGDVKYVDSMGRERLAPAYVIQLSDDGCPNSFSVCWFAYEGLHDGLPKERTLMFRHAENLRYRFSFNGGLIFHGFNRETYSVRLCTDSNPWSIHT